MTSLPSFDTVWHRIQKAEGETFHQIRGQAFTYALDGDYLSPSTLQGEAIARSQFEQAYELVPLKNTVPVQHLWGPSYLYAILMDHRIRKGDW